MRLLRFVPGPAVFFFAGAVAFAATAPDPGRGARGPLPDPELLDGSAQKTEKRADHGMLGEFEIPGDDAKGDKVGGQSDKAGAAGPKMEEPNADQAKGGGAQDKNAQDDKTAQNGGGQQQDKGSQGGGGQQNSGQQGGGGGGGDKEGKSGGGSQQASGSGAQGAGGAQGASGQSGPGGGAQGPSDPNAKASGIQVAQVSAPGQAGAQSGSGGGKPTQIALGDPSMQIKQPASAQGAVGAQVSGSTQQMEKAIGSGTGATGGTSGGRGGSGVEKGQTMPKGL